MKFILRSVPGDGNCLFESIGRTIGLSAKQLREIVVNFMRIPNQTLHGEKLNVWIPDVQKHISNMSKDGTWGTHFEIAIAAVIFDLRILVYHPNSLKEASLIAEFLPYRYGRDASIIFVNENHFMQLIPVVSKTQA